MRTIKFDCIATFRGPGSGRLLAESAEPADDELLHNVRAAFFRAAQSDKSAGR